MRRILIIATIAIIAIAGTSYVVWALSRPAPAAPTGAAGPSFFARLFPFGAPATPATGPNGSENQNPVSIGPRTVPHLREVTAQPVAGGGVWKVGATSTIRYIERATGHLYETPATAPTAVRISNTTIPGIQEVLWASPTEFIIRYLSDGAVQNFHAKVVATTTEQALQGLFLASFDRAAIDPAGKTLLTVTASASGSTVTTQKPDGTSARTLITSPLSSWVPLLTSSDSFLATAPGAGIPGALYRVSSGRLVSVMSNIPGMIALPSPSGRYIALSSGNKNTLALAVLDTKTGTSYASPLGTLASKCAWVSENPVALACGVPETLPAALYPTDWLLGTISLTDDIWRVEPVSGVTSLLTNPMDDANTSIDVWQPKTDGTYLTFINKKNLSFWSLKLAE